MTDIFVYGATGAQGRPVARQLIAAGHSVRILLRADEKAPDLLAFGAQPVIGDMTDPDSLARASDGAAGVFLLVPFLDPKTEYGINAIDAARRHDIPQIDQQAVNVGHDTRKTFTKRSRVPPMGCHRAPVDQSGAVQFHGSPIGCGFAAG